MPNKASEVDQAFSDDFSDFDFSERFGASADAKNASAKEGAPGPPSEDEPPAAPDDTSSEEKARGGDARTADAPADEAPNETAGEDSSAAATDSDEDAARQTTGASAKGGRTSNGASSGSKGSAAPKKDAHPADAVELEPNQTINQEGVIRERPTFYLRPDQMKAVRVAKAMRESPFGRDLSEIAMALFDLHGFGFEADRAKNDNYGYDAEDVLGRLVPEDQWEELLDAARKEEGRRASRRQLMYRVSRFIEDALYEAGYGDGRKRRKK